MQRAVDLCLSSRQGRPRAAAAASQSAAPQPPQQQQNPLRRQLLVRNPLRRQLLVKRRTSPKMPTIVSTPAPRTVVVGDMVVADDDSDSEADVVQDSAAQDNDGEDTDEDARPKVLRVISRTAPATAPTPRVLEPSWHALLRSTPSSRTASIARTVPRGSMSRPPRPATPRSMRAAAPATPSRIIRTDAHHRPAIIVPAKVLVPRTRLMFPLLTRGRTVVPLGRHGHHLTFGAPRPGTLLRREVGAGAPQARIVVSAAGPLSRAENAVLDGVLDLQEERVYRPSNGELELPPKYRPRNFLEYIRDLMDWFAVSSSDAFPGDLQCLPGCSLCARTADGARVVPRTQSKTPSSKYHGLWGRS